MRTKPQFQNEATIIYALTMCAWEGQNHRNITYFYGQNPPSPSFDGDKNFRQEGDKQIILANTYFSSEVSTTTS